MVGILGGSIVVLSLYGFPAVAIGILLYHDYSYGEFEKQKMVVECLYALSIGGVLSIMLADFINPFTPYYIDVAMIVLLTILFPLGWYAFRKKSDSRQPVQRV
ncbi:hypothetical protein SAMN05216564_10576 [Halopenitus persicus]|uniref:Uncharacterized protein n=2 Tax=Halopenitus persicus TaxID=1048396 RepID=A0A1H3JMQ6_9EURY|nr:hypothetical protein SAMN05216564_10576 [Halopenitus persicus]